MDLISLEIGPTTLTSICGCSEKKCFPISRDALAMPPGIWPPGCRFSLFWMNIFSICPSKDGARLHTSHDAMAFLDAYFGPRILSDK